MNDLAQALALRLDDVDISDRSRVEQFLEFLPHIQVQSEIFTAESARNALPAIRKMAEDGTSTLIAARGRVSNLKKTSLVMSIEQFVTIVSTIMDAHAAAVAQRRNPAAILDQLEPTIGELPSTRTRLRATEQTRGGRVRLN